MFPTKRTYGRNSSAEYPSFICDVYGKFPETKEMSVSDLLDVLR